MIQPFDVQKSMTILSGAFLVANGLFDLACIGFMMFFGKRLRETASVVICDAEDEEANAEESIIKK